MFTVLALNDMITGLSWEGLTRQSHNRTNVIFLSTRPSCKSFCCRISVAQDKMVNSALQGAILALLVGAAVAQVQYSIANVL